MLDLAAQQLVALPPTALAALRSALVRDGGPGAVSYLQEAGYAAGESMFDAFASHLRGRGGASPESLPLDEFAREAGGFFATAGWGRLAVTPMGAAVALDAEHWAEADPAAGADYPMCFFTTGLLSSFFGRVAGAPLATLEVECRCAGGDRCRFLVGSAEVMQNVYEQMGQGAGYEAALGAMAA